MNKEAKQLLKELDDFCAVGSPDCTEKFTALCKKMTDSGLLTAEVLSEAFQTVWSQGNMDGYWDGYAAGRDEGYDDCERCGGNC